MAQFKRYVVTTVLLTAFIGVILSGCPAPDRQPAPPPPNATPSPQVPGPNTPAPGAPAQPAPTPNNAQNLEQEGRRLSTAVNKIPEVESSSVVITANRAIVGLNLRADMDAEQVKEIENEAASTVKRINNRITSVTVTSNPDMVARIKGVADGIRQGQPIANFSNELSEINQRLGPTNR